jgi:hypothetical protein
MPPSDAGPQYELAYREALRAIERQEDDLDDLRSRAGLLVAAASVVTSVLGADAIKDGVSGAETVALAAFLLCAAGSVWVLLPTGDWTFKNSAQVLIEEWVEKRGLSLTEMHRELALSHEKHFDDNAKAIRALQLPFQPRSQSGYGRRSAIGSASDHRRGERCRRALGPQARADRPPDGGQPINGRSPGLIPSCSATSDDGPAVHDSDEVSRWP